MISQKIVRLHDIQGIARKRGTDEHGNAWIEDECNDESMTCEICGAEIWSGWTCLDGGEFVCAEHVEYE